MSADDLGHGVAVRIGGVGVFPGEISGVHVKSTRAVDDAIICVSDSERGNLIAQTVREKGIQINPALRKSCSRVQGAQENMVIGVAGNKFIQQGR